MNNSANPLFRLIRGLRSPTGQHRFRMQEMFGKGGSAAGVESHAGRAVEFRVVCPVRFTRWPTHELAHSTVVIPASDALRPTLRLPHAGAGLALPAAQS